jgi:aminocarboxymuconate-semialdehyde decarboxylase
VKAARAGKRHEPGQPQAGLSVMSAEPEARSLVVDHQTHWYPREALELLLGRGSVPRAVRDSDGYILETVSGMPITLSAAFVELEFQFDDMNSHGVDAMVSSPAVWLGDTSLYDLGLACELCALLNEEVARAQHAYPDRFYGLAVLPVQDGEAAVHAVETAAALGLRGVCLHSNVDSQAIVTENLWPVYQRIAELGMTLVLHPTVRTAMSCTYGRFGEALERLTWFFDTSAAALAIIHGGVLDAYPDLTVLHPHLGGVLPFLRGRIEAIDRAGVDTIEHSVEEYLRTRFYVDSVTETPGSLAMAAALYGPERIVFASDYPWMSRAPALQMVRAEHPAAFSQRLFISDAPGMNGGPAEPRTHA